MPEIRPFPGIRYRVPEAELARLLAPPYDVIGPGHQAELYARDPRNVVRVILNRTPGEAGYVEAGETYRRWLAEGILAADAEPALYLLEQGLEVEGRALTRVGLLARFRAEDPGTGAVLPHEQTRAGPKQDRWRALLATRANFSPIFLMFKDPEGRFAALASRATSAPPDLACDDGGGVRHRLWRVGDPAAISALAAVLAAVTAYIADGHHRYATALRYREEKGPEGAWTFGYFTPMDSPGLLVLPYHRILSRSPSLEAARRALGEACRVSEAAGPAEAARRAAASEAPYAFGLAFSGGGALLAESRPGAEALLSPEAPPSLRALDTYFFHRAVLGRLLAVPEDSVGYVHSLAEAEQALAAGACAAAALMRATPVRQIVDVAEARESMPAKSTFFHPKLPSGLVIHPLPA